MTPADAVASLDASLHENGSDVILRRIGSPPLDVPVRAHARGYLPKELTGSVQMGDTRVIISPTQIIAAGWKAIAVADGTDDRVPVPGNKLIVAGRARHVMAAVPIYMAGELVRIEMQVRG